MTHSEKELATYKDRLLEEKRTLEKELEDIGSKNPQNPADWQAEAPAMGISEADRNEAADRIEGLEENTAILDNLEVRYNNVKAALARLDAGTYGTCEVGGEPIEPERLDANPAARTCAAHREEELA